MADPGAARDQDPATGRATPRDIGAAHPESPDQAAHRQEYDQLRAGVGAQLATVRAAEAGSTAHTAALASLCAVADRLVASSVAMAARMDAEAHATSRRIVRGAAAVVAGVAGVFVVLVAVVHALGWGWLLGVAMTLLVAGMLATADIAPAGRPAHRAQRRPALVGAVLAAAGLTTAVVSSWWLLAVLLLAASVVSAAIVLDGPSGKPREDR
jgi:hypothetical protein